jgi:hypothetical protein
MFAGDYFADSYKASRLGRPTVPARVLATVMCTNKASPFRFGGCSTDRHGSTPHRWIAALHACQAASHWDVER